MGLAFLLGLMVGKMSCKCELVPRGMRTWLEAYWTLHVDQRGLAQFMVRLTSTSILSDDAPAKFFACPCRLGGMLLARIR